MLHFARWWISFGKPSLNSFLWMTLYLKDKISNTKNHYSCKHFRLWLMCFKIRQTVTVKANYYEEPVRNACNLFDTQQSHILYLGVTHYIKVYRLLPLSDAFWYFFILFLRAQQIIIFMNYVHPGRYSRTTLIRIKATFRHILHNFLPSEVRCFIRGIKCHGIFKSLFKN